jgi:hypothetical protein
VAKTEQLGFDEDDEAVTTFLSRCAIGGRSLHLTLPANRMSQQSIWTMSHKGEQGADLGKMSGYATIYRGD